MSTPANTTIAGMKATHVSTPAPDTNGAIALVKALLIVARKLDRDAGVTDTNYEALVLAAATNTDPSLVVP